MAPPTPFVGLILTTCNDLELTKVCLPSLKASMPVQYRWGVIVIDSGSTDGTLEYLEDNNWPCYGPHSRPDTFPYKTEHLCEALNAGINLWLGKGGDGQFYKAGAVPYIGWIHADMEFPQEGWLNKLVEFCLEYLDTGKVSPNDVGMGGGDRPGNSCPWIVPTTVLMKLHETDGYFFDENFKYTQNYDDWDFNRRIINLGYDVMITERSKVIHEGMGTRKTHTDKKYAEAGKHNMRYYISKWGDGKNPV